MNIIISKSQIEKIINEVKYVSKNDILGKEVEDKVEFTVIGVYGIKDMNEFFNSYPFKTLRKLPSGLGTMESDWKNITQFYPLVVIKIVYSTGKQKNYTSTYYKNARDKESYSLTDNELFILFRNDGTAWKTSRLWLSKQQQNDIKMFKDILLKKSPEEFVNGLLRLSYFKSHNSVKILSQLVSILSGVPKTKQEDLYVSDFDINQEFREPIRFTVVNGDDPKPIVDKILKKYGRLTSDIEHILNSKFIQIHKHKRPNPYL